MVAGPSGVQPAPAADLTVVFAQEPWYRERTEAERDWDGTLRRRTVIAGPNARTALRYSLIVDGRMLAVYAPTDRLEPFVDARVRIRGKLVDLSPEGFGPELWPGAAERLP
jgi:hypothetical protein